MRDELTGKRLLLLGATENITEIVKEAQAMGIKACVTDYYENSPAKKIADESFMVSAMDVDSIVELCREKSIDGVYTSYIDRLLPSCQEVCEKLSMPFCGNAHNIQLSSDKEQFKEACERSGVRVVPWMKVDQSNWMEAMGSMELPAVVKPADYSGSKGVFKCYQRDQLRTCIEDALSYSKAGKVLVEHMMDVNNEFTAYYMIYQGVAYLCAMGDRYVNVIDPLIAPVGLGMIYPSIYLDLWLEQMDGPVKRFFADNDINDGFVFLQGFYEAGRLYVHEMGYRLNGGFTYDIIQHFSGYNQLRELLRFSLTGKMDGEAISHSDARFNGYGMIFTISLKRGTIAEIQGIQEIEAIPGVLAFHQLHHVGDSLTAHGTTAQVFGYILVGVASKEDLERVLQDIEAKLVIKDQDGNSMLRKLLQFHDIKLSLQE